jgi:hypothetical protein
MSPGARLWLLVSSVVLGACSGPGMAGRRMPSHYSQQMDSASSTCLRNPACYTAQPGEEAVIPWLSRAVEVVRIASATLKLLEAEQLQRVEAILMECADHANLEVNLRLPEGRPPDKKMCEEVRGYDSRNNPITRAMELGQEKHEEALTCVQARLDAEVPGHFSLEPRYYLDPKTGRLRLIAPELVAEWLRDGLEVLLMGTVIPDVVLHARGNPLQVQAVYDFKFPCPASSHSPRWRDSPADHPYSQGSQKDLYQKALGVEPRLVAPVHGVI